MIQHYLKIAIRNLWKYKVQNIIGILGVALGLACFTLCCYIPRYLSGWNKSYTDSDRLYGIMYKGDFPSIDLRTKLLNKYPADVENTTYFSPARLYNMVFETENRNSREYEIGLSECDTSIISFFSLKIVAGTLQNMININNSIVLFESFAKKMGKPESLIGKSVSLQEKYYQITGIIKDFPKNSAMNTECANGLIFNVIDGFMQKAKFDPILYNVEIYPVPVKIKKGIKVEQFQQKLNAMAQADGRGESYEIRQFPNLMQQPGVKMMSSIIVIIGFLILATGLFNYISFLLAQCYNRLGNYSLRKVNGSSRNNFFGLVFTEFIIVWILAGILSFSIPDLIAPYFDSLKIQYIPIYFDSGVIGRQILEYILLGIPCIALLCFFLATNIEKLSIRSTILGIVNKGNRMILRNVLLAVQMFIFIGFASAVVIVYMQMNKSYNNIFSTFTSEEKENTFIIDCSGKKHLMDNKEILLSKIKSSSLVRKATYAYSNFHYSYSGKIITDSILTEKTNFSYAVRNYVSPEFPEFFNVKVLAGKFMDAESAPDMVVIDEKFAALYKGENPIGKSFYADGSERYTIIGIVQNVQYFKDLTNSNLIKSKNPPVYYVSDISPWKDYCIYVQPITGKSKELKQHLEKCVREFLPSTIDFKIITLAEFIKEKIFIDDIVLLKTGSLFGSIALAICLLSLYSSVTMNTERRRKEIAIRKINGAGVWDIIRLFANTYLSLSTIACILSFPLIYLIGNNWLEQYTQRIFLSPVFFIGIFLIVSTLMFVTIVFRIKKVAGENPAEVIKGN